MDTSDEYISMCEKAKKYMWPDGYFMLYNYGLYYESTTKRVVTTLEVSNPMYYKGSISNQTVWMDEYVPLWSQDQLQEMVEGYIEFFRSDLGEWQAQNDNNDGMFSTAYWKSAEQALLCLVMNHKFNKAWNGTDWQSI